MKVVVVGAGGMLGAVTVHEWRHHGHEVVALTRAELDVTRSREVSAAIGGLAPDVVINCTAYNRVDDAEDDPATALAVNTWAVRSMAKAAGRVGATFVHYSSDFVFDGATDCPYMEGDIPNPQSVYGMSKLMGEWFAAEGPQMHYVLRVESLFGGAASRSTIDRMVENMRAGRTVQAFSDRTVSPSHTQDVARATRQLVALGGEAGLYHCVNSGKATWLDVAEALRVFAGFHDAEIVAISSTDVPMRARRPRFAALSNAKLVGRGIPMPDWRECLAAHCRSVRDC